MGAKKRVDDLIVRQGPLEPTGRSLGLAGAGGVRDLGKVDDRRI